MIEFELAHKILLEIILEDKTFHEAVKSKRKDEQFKDHLPQVTALVGSELRHHEFIKYVARDFNLREEDRILLYLVLTNAFFLKRYNVEDTIAYLKSVYKDDFTPEMEKLVLYSGPLSELSIKDDSKNKIYATAMRFNVPSYLLKMWIKHYGLGTSYRFLKRNIRSSLSFYRVNEMKISEEALLNKNLGFEKTNFPNIVTYHGEGNIRSNEAYRSYEVFTIRIALKNIFDKVFNDDIEYMTVYSGHDDSIIREGYLRSNKKIGLSIAVPSLDERPEILRLIRVEKPKNVNLFEANDLSMMAAALTSKQDLIVVMPKSSSFDYIRHYPDYLLHFKQESFDGLIQTQKDALENFATYLNEDGTLVYVVDTLNKKESESVINDFLNRHKDFELVEANQLLSSSEEDTTVYYAILKKKAND